MCKKKGKLVRATRLGGILGEIKTVDGATKKKGENLKDTGGGTRRQVSCALVEVKSESNVPADYLKEKVKKKTRKGRGGKRFCRVIRFRMAQAMAF